MTFWIGVVLCLAPIVIYLWSDGLSWRPTSPGGGERNDLALIDELEKAVTLGSYVAIDIVRERRFSPGHEHPILALYVRRQAGAGQRG